MPSLRNLCLYLIAEQFERFHLAIAESSDANLKQNLEFLQRTYPSELASELCDRKKLKEEYLEFIINKNLKYLNEKWLLGSRYHNSMEDVFSRLPNLTKVYCFRNSDEILKNVAKYCPEIVDIDATFLTDEGVKYLCAKDNGNIPCPKIKRISVNSINYRLTDKGLKLILQNIKSLERLRHSSVPSTLYCIHKKHLPDFDKMSRYNLVELSMSEDERAPHYNDLLKINLTVCPKLKYLSCCITDEEQLSFFKNICLEELILSFKKSKQQVNVDSFLRNCGRTLVTFRVYNCKMSISELAAGCPNLKCLVIDDVTFLEEQCDSKAVFRSLVNCTFSQTKDKSISDKAMTFFLSSSPNLQHIKFVHKDLSPETKTSILKWCEKHVLKSIAFVMCTDLEKSFVKDILVNSPSLKTMEIWSCPIPEQDELVQFAKTLSNKPRIILY